MPSVKRNPTAKARSDPGVRIVVESGFVTRLLPRRNFTMISSGSSTVRSSLAMRPKVRLPEYFSIETWATPSNELDVGTAISQDKRAEGWLKWGVGDSIFGRVIFWWGKRNGTTRQVCRESQVLCEPVVDVREPRPTKMLPVPQVRLPVAH